MKLNIGCGPYKTPGWVNIDRNPQWNPDIVRDVTRGLPFSDSTVHRINTTHFLEHLASQDLLFVIEECWRVLIPGGTMYVIVPIGNTGDLDHLMQFTEQSFAHLLRDDAQQYYQTPMKWNERKRKVTHDGRNSILAFTWEAVKTK